MDLFRYLSAPNAPMRGGELILPSDSITWTERYREASDVKIEADISSGLRQQLPIGTVISHIESKEVMRVEDHQIVDDDVSESDKLIITGRSIEAPLLENRATGTNITFPTAAEPVEYILPSATIQNQAVQLIRSHTEAFFLIDDNDAVPYLETLTTISGGVAEELRKIQVGTVYQRLLEILGSDNLGIRSNRPITNALNTELVIFKGADRSLSVSMSIDKGDVESTEYLESIREMKNCALIIGKWTQTRIVAPGVTGYDRRWMVVDASDIDENLDAVPTGTTRTDIIAKMQTRGRTALANQNRIQITKAEASKDVVSAIFRKDYNVGDIVLVSGGYGSSTKMRVTEHVEIQDDTGFTSYPTLESLEGEEE